MPRESIEYQFRGLSVRRQLNLLTDILRQFLIVLVLLFCFDIAHCRASLGHLKNGFDYGNAFLVERNVGVLHDCSAHFRVVRNAKAEAANVQVHKLVLMGDAEGFILLPHVRFPICILSFLRSDVFHAACPMRGHRTRELFVPAGEIGDQTFCGARRRQRVTAAICRNAKSGILLARPFREDGHRANSVATGRHRADSTGVDTVAVQCSVDISIHQDLAGDVIVSFEAGKPGLVECAHIFMFKIVMGRYRIPF